MARVLRRSSSHALVGVKRRGTAWLGSAIATDTSTLAAGAVVLDQSFTGAQSQAKGDFTIVRTRGLLSVASDQSIATEEPFGALGFMVIREAARVIGVTAIARAYDDAKDDGWFVHQYWRAACRVGTDIGFQGGSSWWTHYVIDSKAMRKVESTDAIAIVLENSDAVGGIVYLLDFRILVKTL